MVYRIIYSPHAIRDLDHLPGDDRDRIIYAIGQIANDPVRQVKLLKNTPFFSLRVGKYWVIVDIQHKGLVVIVIRVGHRRNIYKHL